MKQFYLKAKRPNYKLVFLGLVLALIGKGLFAQNDKLWRMGGQNLHNTRNACAETIISPNTARDLTVKWVFATDSDVSATPAVDENFVYFPDWAGNLYKLDASTGVQVWKKKIKNYTGESQGFARATPALSGNTLIEGTQLGDSLGAYVLAINKKDGSLIWKTKVDTHRSATITQGAIISGGRVFVGVSSAEEAFAEDSTYPCCSFRGSMLSLDLATGSILWKTYIVPEGKGFTGGAVWGSTAVLDAKRNSLYIATGNNYTVPQAVLDCETAGGTSKKVRACIEAVPGSSENYFDAVMALDPNTGAIKWTRSVIPFDAWNVACIFGGPNCPDTSSPDYDFGQGPALFTVNEGGQTRDLVGAGQKSGKYWALNPNNGDVVWHTDVGPGSTLGGLEWGSAVNGKQVVTAVSNNGYIPYTLTEGPGTGKTVRGGFWAGLDAATGTVLWQNAATNPPVGDVPAGAVASNTGAVSLANGVAFAGALDSVGTMYAFNAATGEKLWSFKSGGSVNSGPAIVEGVVYWGSGYANIDGTPNHKFYAFVPKTAIAASQANNITGNDHYTGEAVSVYPNPAKDKVTIVSNDKTVINDIQLFDLAGKLLKDYQISTQQYELNLASLVAGSYVIHVTTSKQNVSKNIIVMH
jgi:polyvinyl alcohol dehydrogenase (cytochrome)